MGKLAEITLMLMTVFGAGTQARSQQRPPEQAPAIAPQPPTAPMPPAAPQAPSEDAGPVPAPPPSQGGIIGGVRGGIVGGVRGGIIGGVREGIIGGVGEAVAGEIRGEIVGAIRGITRGVPGEPQSIVPPLPPTPLELPDLPDLPELPELPDLTELQASVEALQADLMALHAPVLAGPMLAFEKPRTRSDEDDHYYERGQRDLERSRWEEAVGDFTEAATRGGSRADGALYWKAYAQNKLGRREDALATLGELHKTYPNSRWMDDAKALEIEVRQASGKQVNPESANDDELKLMALNGLMNSDPERAIPMIEKLLHSSQSPKIKERALFVLTQAGSPHATQLVVQMAKGASNPDLQMKAVKYLGVMGAQKELGEVYIATNDVAVRREVLHAFMVAGAHDQLLAAAKKETNPELRRVAINQLGVIGAHGDLWQLYQVEPTVEIKRQIINALFVGGDADHLLEIARTAKEPELKRDAIRGLGNMGEQRAGNALAAMYASESDPAVRKEIIRALFVQGNAHALVEIARKEANVDMKKEIVRHLSNMQSKEGTDYLMELLK